MDHLEIEVMSRYVTLHVTLSRQGGARRRDVGGQVPFGLTVPTGARTLRTTFGLLSMFEFRCIPFSNVHLGYWSEVARGVFGGFCTR